MTKLLECLASNIRKFRKMRHLTQEQLAEKAGTSTTYIGTIEIGRKFPSPKMIDKIAEALEIESLQLFQTGENFYIEQNQKDMNGLKKELLNNIKKVVEETIKNY